MRPRARPACWPLAFGALACVLFGLAYREFGPYLAREDLDHGIHLRFAQGLAAGGLWLPHFGYHLLVALAAGLSIDLDALRRAAQAVLGLLVLARLGLALGLARSLLERAGSRLAPSAAAALAVALCFAAPLPQWWSPENVYLGQLSPTVWHNPTAIAALPPAVAAFWAFLLPRERRLRHDAAAGLLLAVSVLFKPNFALAFLPAATLLRLAERERPLLARLDRIGALAAPAVAALAWQWAHSRAIGLEAEHGGLVSFAPLEVWELFSPHPFASALVSLAFPLAVVLACGRRPRLGGALAASWAVALVAIAEFALVAEPEPRLGDGNYYWGVVPAVFLLFLVSACELLCSGSRSGSGEAAAAAAAPPGRPARLACWAVLALHVASGFILYLRPFQLAVED